MYTQMELAEKVGIKSSGHISTVLQRLKIRPSATTLLPHGKHAVFLYDESALTKIKAYKKESRNTLIQAAFYARKVKEQKHHMKKSMGDNVSSVETKEKDDLSFQECLHRYIPYMENTIETKNYSGTAFGSKTETKVEIIRSIQKMICEKCLHIVSLQN